MAGTPNSVVAHINNLIKELVPPLPRMNLLSHHYAEGLYNDATGGDQRIGAINCIVNHKDGSIVTAIISNSELETRMICIDILKLLYGPINAHNSYYNFVMGITNGR